MPRDLELLITLSPSMNHFSAFAEDERLNGIRINSAMIYADELEAELKAAKPILDRAKIPLHFDLKGRQLRIKDVRYHTDSHLELTLNHRIDVKCPTPILFKAGQDHALLIGIRNDSDGQQWLVFQRGQKHAEPFYQVKKGESICIRDSSFKILDETFPAYEIERIKRVAAGGWTRYFLSYIESQRDIDEFREYVGRDVEVVAKIESRKGLQWVANGYKPQKNLRLMAARGDLFVEITRPDEMLNAQRLIIEKDPQAMVGSRLLLSLVPEEAAPPSTANPALLAWLSEKKYVVVPNAADFEQLAWLYDIGYRSMMLCDELCIKEDRLKIAVAAFDGFRDSYVKERARVTKARKQEELTRLISSLD